MELRRKLEILADAAKYDASCASSGTEKRDSRKGGIGSTEGPFAVTRARSNARRARSTVPELVGLPLDFYRRNYIEGLFLSSGIIRSPDYTMEQVVAVARELREKHDFR